ncbi:ATP-dependent DNA helicase pcra [Coprinopsis sp. MPI-PUGE-AT-0042]|nr:ATP-dependent DNA helicase pcra [Coprinopsis sp. MPI-PUGE-AT-0042]
MEVNFIDALNEVQKKAATYSPNTSLQILAGPGSGKTRVLTSRIAYLIINCHLPPKAICAVTFTNKAANEMRERLTKLIGKDRTSQLKLGTFHSICARYLRQYAKEAGVPDNFTVCDANESKKMITHLMKGYQEVLTERGFSLEPAGCASMISKAKSKGLSAKDYLAQALAVVGGTEASAPGSLEVVVGKIYVEYEAALRRINALDFDDLLVYGVKLFTNHQECAIWCKHILVDEFQDTNITQYELMRKIGLARCITIVGDPDQSIYGWRSADVGNLSKMRRDFPNTAQILLEENYRSTGAILQASLAIVSQDKKRIDKSLFTSHPSGVTPVLYQVENEYEESAFIAIEIKRMVASMGGALRWGDFAVLLRFNALSRNIEKALQNEKIPYRVLGGHKFFERLEVKDMLAYLQLIDNPVFGPAFNRVINVPGRGIGEKTLNDISRRADECGKGHLELLEAIYERKLPDQKPAIRKKISSFIEVIKALRQYAEEGMGPADLLRKLVDLSKYEEHLRKTQQDWETRMENVKELVSFAKEMEEQNQREKMAAELAAVRTGEVVEEDELSPLRQFLQVSMLSSEGDNDSEEDSKEKVTITTCHSAKGLEWPAVIVPSVDSSTYPFSRSEDEDEERRLLYVGCTRAKSLLYLTRAKSRMVAANVKQKTLSKFVVNVLESDQKQGKGPSFIQHLPHLEKEDRDVICKVLGRPAPDERDVESMMNDFYKLGRDVPQNTVWRPIGANIPESDYLAKPSPPERRPEDFPRSYLTNLTFEPTFGRPSLSSGPAPIDVDHQARSRSFQSLHASSGRNPSTSSATTQQPLTFVTGGGMLGTRAYANLTDDTPSSQTCYPLPRAFPAIASTFAPPVAGPSRARSPISRTPQLSRTIVDGVTNTGRLPRLTEKGKQPAFGATPIGNGDYLLPSPPSSSSNFNSPIRHTSSTPLSQPVIPRPPAVSSSAYQNGRSTTGPRQRPPPPLQTVSNVLPPIPGSDRSGLPEKQPSMGTAIAASAPQPLPVGTKRRLGVGRGTIGYSNKKFKPPAPS